MPSCGTNCPECDVKGLCLRCPKYFNLAKSGESCSLLGEQILLHIGYSLVALIVLILVVGCGTQGFKWTMIFARSRWHKEEGRDLRKEEEDNDGPEVASQESKSQPLLTGGVQAKETNLAKHRERSRAAILHGTMHFRLSRLLNWTDHRYLSDPTKLPGHLDHVTDGKGLVDVHGHRCLRSLVNMVKSCGRQGGKLPRPRTYRAFYSVHFDTILGIGLPLFYNFYMLPLSMGLCLWWQLGGIKPPADDFDGKTAVSYISDGVIPALTRSIITCCFVTFCYALLTTRFQRLYNSENTVMSDYVMHMEGLPAVLCDERKVLQELKEQIPYHEIIGVSIGYNLAADDKQHNQRVGDEIFDMRENLMAQKDYDAYHNQILKDMIQEDANSPDALKALHFGYPAEALPVEKLPIYRSAEEPGGTNEDVEKEMGTPTTYWGPKEKIKSFPKACKQLFDERVEKDRKRFNEMLEPQETRPQTLKGSGHCFIVFKSKADAFAVAQKFNGMWFTYKRKLYTEEEVKQLKANILEDDGDAKREPIAKWRGYKTIKQDFVLGTTQLRKGTQILTDAEGRLNIQVQQEIEISTYTTLKRVRGEPPSVLWFTLGTKHADFLRNICMVFVKSCLMFALVIVLIYWPLTNHITHPYALACTDEHMDIGPNPITQQLMGLLFGLVNNLLNIVAVGSAESCGFAFKESLDLFILVYNSVISFLATLFNLYVAIWSQMVDFARIDFQLFDPISLERELKFSDDLYNILIPGFLFQGYYIGQLVGLILPFTQNYLCLQCVFVGKCLPNSIMRYLCTPFIPWNPSPPNLDARRVEHILESKLLGLAWDYANLIVMPSICLLTLFSFSTNAHRIFPFMAAWVVVAYIWHRCVMLRTSKKQIHSSPILDDCVIYLWGVPISLLYAARCFWSARTDGHHPPITSSISDPTLLHVTKNVLIFFSLYVLIMHWIITKKKKEFHLANEERFEYAATKLVYNWFNCNPVHCLKAVYAPEFLERPEGMHEFNEKARSNPKFMQVRTDLLKDPIAAVKKYGKDEEVQKFIADKTTKRALAMSALTRPSAPFEYGKEYLIFVRDMENRAARVSAFEEDA